MKEILKQIAITSVTAVIVVMVVFAIVPNNVQNFASMDSNRIKSANVTTDSSVSVATSSTLLLAGNSARSYGAIVNFGSTGIFLSLDGTVAVDSAGIYLAPNGGSYEITPENLFISPIYGIATTSPSTVTVIEASGN